MAPPHLSLSEMSEKRFQSGCLGRFMKSGMEGAIAGVVMGYGIIAWYPDPYLNAHKGTEVFHPLDFRYVLRNLKAPVMWGTLVCATYSGVECTLENLRDESKSSTWVNSAAAGATAGFVMGSMSKRLDIMCTSALGVGLLMGMFEYNSHYVAAEQGTLATNRGPSVAELKKKYPKFKEI